MVAFRGGAAVAAVLALSLALASAGPLLSAIPIDVRLFNKTYSGRGVQPDSQVFSNELVVRQSVEGAQTIFKNLLSGKKTPPAPAASPKRKVCCCLRLGGGGSG